MYGASIGFLRVIVVPANSTGGNNGTVVWELSGNQGQSWIQGRVPVYDAQPFYVS